MNTPIENIPMNVSIYNQQFIEDLMATDTSELLAYEASAVKANENDNFLMRGFANPGSNFLNGFAQTGGFGSRGHTLDPRRRSKTRRRRSNGFGRRWCACRNVRWS